MQENPSEETLDNYLNRIEQRGRSKSVDLQKYKEVRTRWISPNFIFDYPFFAVVVLCGGEADRRNFLYAAHKKGMTTSDYVYIYYALLPGDDEIIPWVHGENVTEEEINFRKAAHKSLKQVYHAY